MDDIHVVLPHFSLWLRHAHGRAKFPKLTQWMRTQCDPMCRLRVSTYRGLKGHLVNVHAHDASLPEDQVWRAAFRAFIDDMNAGHTVRMVRRRGILSSPFLKNTFSLPVDILEALRIASRSSGLNQSQIVACALVFYLGLEQPIDERMREIAESGEVDVDL